MEKIFFENDQIFSEFKQVMYKSLNQSSIFLILHYTAWIILSVYHYAFWYTFLHRKFEVVFEGSQLSDIIIQISRCSLGSSKTYKMSTFFRKMYFLADFTLLRICRHRHLRQHFLASVT